MVQFSGDLGEGSVISHTSFFNERNFLKVNYQGHCPPSPTKVAARFGFSISRCRKMVKFS